VILVGLQAVLSTALLALDGCCDMSSATLASFTMGDQRCSHATTTATVAVACVHAWWVDGGGGWGWGMGAHGGWCNRSVVHASAASRFDAYFYCSDEKVRCMISVLKEWLCMLLLMGQCAG
jgi:hypothetical protein